MRRSKIPTAADRIAAECLAVRMRLLNRVVTNLYDDALRPLGLKVGQMNILVVIARMGSAAPTAVGRTLHMEKSTLSRNVERMRKRGWLRVEPGPDERTHRLRVTDKGKKLLDKAVPLWERAQHQTEDLLGQTGARTLTQTARRVWAKDPG